MAVTPYPTAAPAPGSALGFRAGAAVEDITPEVGNDLSGYAARQAPASGIHDHLTASALAVSDGATTSLVIAADLVALDPEQVEEIVAELCRLTGLPAEGIAVSVSHTHSGPAVTRSGIGGVANPSYVLGMLDTLVRVGVNAVRRLEPAALYRGSAQLNGVASNRRGGRVTDPLVPVIQLRRSDGTRIATVFSHACHPVTLGPDNLLVTADWPGFARQALAQTHDGISVFLQGCCGQLNTGHAATDSTSDSPASDQRTFDAATVIGTRVAEAVTTALDKAVEVRPVAGIPIVRIATQFLDLPREDGEQTVTVPVSAHRWGDLRIVFLPGEPFVEFALELREALAEPQLPVIGYTGGVPGYLPYPAEHYAAGGYEVTDAHYWYGQPAAFAPAAGERVRQVAEQLCRQVNGDG